MQDKKIIELYLQGNKAIDIGQKLGVCVGTMYNALKRNNVDTQYWHRVEWDDKTTKTIIEQYQNGVSVSSLSKTWNVSKQTIQSLLDKMNIKKVTQSMRFNPEFNERYFETIDTPDKAYWLGWLITDGGVMENTASIAIALHGKDKNILELFQTDLGLKNKIHTVPNSDDKYVKFSFSSRTMLNDLSQYGIIQNKTFSVEFPNVPYDLQHHLLRGAFDGDGGLSIAYRNKRPVFELIFCGNIQSVSQFNKAIAGIDQSLSRKITKNNNIWRIRWSSSRHIISVLDYLYQDCGSHFLSRKYDLYQRIKELT